jgi:hypothetical protein
LLVRGIRLRVLHVAPEYEAEFASFKADFRRARFERAKARGAYANCGRPRTIDRAAIQNLNAKGMSPAAITRELGGAVGRSTVYRISKELKAAA